MARRKPFYTFIADLYMALEVRGQLRPSYTNESDSGIYSVTEGQRSWKLTQSITIVDTSLPKSLKSSAAIRLFLEIISDLPMNNPLWECLTKDKRQTRIGLAELKQLLILIPVPGTDLYIVNPEKIRRGDPLGILASLYQYALEQYKIDPHWWPTSADVQTLSRARQVIVSQAGV